MPHTRSTQREPVRRAQRERAQSAPAAPLPGGYAEMLALAHAAGNAAMGRMLGGPVLARTKSEAGDDVATVDDLEDLVEDRDPPARPRSRSAPPALGSGPPLAVVEPAPVQDAAEEEVASPGGAAPGVAVSEAPAQAVEAPKEAPGGKAPEEAVEAPKEEAPGGEAPKEAPGGEAPVEAVEAPVEEAAAAPAPAWPKKPRVPKSPQPLPDHPTIGDNEAFNVQAHAQSVRDDLTIAGQGGGATVRDALSSKLAEVGLVASGKSDEPLPRQREAIARAEAAYRPLREALEKRQADALADAVKPECNPYQTVRDDAAKARAGYVRYDWAAVTTAVDALEKRVKKAKELETLAGKATTSVAYLNADAQLDAFTGFDKISQRQDLEQIVTRVNTRHAAPNLTNHINLIAGLLGKVERAYTDITLRPDVEAAVHEPITSAQKGPKKRAARATLKTLLDNGVVRRGKIIEKYADTPNGPGFYGVEWTLEGTDRIVIHSHIDSNGNANDPDATHFKLRGEKLRAGTSVGMPDGWKGDALMDPDTNRRTPCPFSAA